MILVGDCLEVMRTLEPNSVDSIVTDPPYGLGFMGKAWDHGVPGVPFWLEMLRVAKPGAYLAAFGGTRTFHRLACAIEDAGWEIRDTLMWVYGTGFPKSHNGEWGGTALKPAWEPIILARKPLVGTVAANFAEHGTGGLNIAGCRIPIDVAADASQLRSMKRSQRESDDGWGMSTTGADEPVVVRADGRWPANVLHDGSPEVLAAFPDAPGQAASVSGPTADGASGSVFGKFAGRGQTGSPRLDSGSAARFFYCAKASREDRNDGCDGMERRLGPEAGGSRASEAGRRGGYGAPRENHHPTVKPTALMRWLCRLVTPPGGLVLDPFAGSGSTGRGALAEGMKFIGIELDPEYARIAEARIKAMQPGLSLGSAA